MTIYEEVRERLTVDYETVLVLLLAAVCGGALVGVLWGMGVMG